MNTQSIKGFLSHFLFLVSLFLFSAHLYSATIFVGPPPASIQAAIDIAAPGDTIQLSAGTYIQKIQVISKSINIVGAGQNLTTIRSPGALTPLTQYFTYGTANFWCVVMIDNQAAPTAQVVNISDLTVSGSDQQDTTTLPAPSPGFYGSSNRFFAIGYHDAGGSIQNVHTTSTRQSANFNELAGGGIVNASSNGNVTFDVANSLVDFYQRQGIDFRGSTLTANLYDSTISRGYALTPNTVTAAPNGIQYSGGASGSVVNNVIEGNISTVANAQSSGIIPFGAGPNLAVWGNTINNNDIGIAAIQNGHDLFIGGNIVNFTTSGQVNPVEGIVVQDTDGLTTLNSNIMNNIPDINMDLSTTASDQNFQLMNNQFFGSQVGMLVSGTSTSGPVIVMDGDSFIGTTGYYIQESTSPNGAPNDIWPSTSNVSFDGLVSGHMTVAEYNNVLAKIFDKHNDSSLGLVLDYVAPSAPVLTGIYETFGPAAGGNIVTITGSNFLSSNTTVFFGPAPGQDLVIVSDSQMYVTAPAGVGTVDVVVVTPFGYSPVIPVGSYTYALAPMVSKAFDPNILCKGSTTELIITLSNSNDMPASLTAPLIDNLPSGVKVHGHAVTDCGGVVTAIKGSGTVTLESGMIPANDSCTILVEVKPNHVGTVTNTLPSGSLVTDLGGNTYPASATITTLPRSSCHI